MKKRWPWSRRPETVERPQLTNTLARVSQQLAVVVAQLEQAADRQLEDGTGD